MCLYVGSLEYLLLKVLNVWEVDHKLVVSPYAIYNKLCCCFWSSTFWHTQEFCVSCIGEKDYYERQIATLKSFEEVDLAVSSEGLHDEDLEEQAQHERAMKISNYANIVLLAFKVRCY